MWISQTYITNLNAAGSVAAYFLFESYRDDHKKLQERVQAKLGNLARSFGDDAHLFVPSEEARSTIEREFNEWLHSRNRLGNGLEVELPGILVLQHALGDKRSMSDDAAYISLSGLLEEATLNNAGRFASESDRLFRQVSDAFAALKSELDRQPDGIEKALHNLQLKPGLWGVGYDLKPHLVSMIRRFRRP